MSLIAANLSRAFFLAIALMQLWPALAHAQTRRLSWDSLDVQATLDADGRLHVTERHAMRMDGEWNGGERRFRVEPRHALYLVSLREIARDGTAHIYRPGPLNNIGEYAFTDAKTVRWRSRLPSDPPFRDALRVYELRYVLSGILIPMGSEYVIDHDFAFPERDGVIHKFSATLQLDPAWQPIEPFAHTIERFELAPGRSAVRRVTLRYARAGRPAAAADKLAALHLTAPSWISASMFASLLLLIAAGVTLIVRRERASGHLDPLPHAALVDRNWLTQHVFCHPAELIGAAWDRAIGAPEVAALLARLTAEGKLTSQVREPESKKSAPVLQLKLCCDRSQFRGYERALIDKLFFAGDTTDTARVRAYYADSGLDPAALIKPYLEQDVIGHFGKPRAAPAWPSWIAVGAFVLTVIILQATTNPKPSTLPWTLSTTLIAGMVWAVAGYQASKYRDTVTDVRTRARKLALAVAALLAWLAGVYLVFDSGLTIIQLALVEILMLSMLFHVARKLERRDLPVSYELRRRIAAAREHFMRELESPAPHIDDAWFPYLIAFGLAPNIAKWFRAFGGTTHVDDDWTRASSSSALASSTPSWSGGGGAFGGAGASGAWALAVSAVAAGVSAPSSSSGSDSSSSSSSSDSSSSGGGGGGGW